MNVQELMETAEFSFAIFKFEYHIESDREEIWILKNKKDFQRYINQFGNQEIKLIRSSEEHLSKSKILEKYYYSVPAFAEKRRLYSEAKAKDCAIWGCE